MVNRTRDSEPKFHFHKHIVSILGCPELQRVDNKWSQDFKLTILWDVTGSVQDGKP